MTSRIASPDNEVDGIFEIVVDPLESSIDQGEGRVTVGLLGAEDAGIASAPVASIITVCGGGLAVEWVWVEICRQELCQWETSSSGVPWPVWRTCNVQEPAVQLPVLGFGRKDGRSRLDGFLLG